MASFGKIIVNYKDSIIRQSEVDILENGDWLNDATIGFYYDYLTAALLEKNEMNTYVRLYHPGLSQYIKKPGYTPQEIASLLGEPPAADIQYAFFVVNDAPIEAVIPSGTHWSLLVFSRPDNTFLMIDSSKGSPNVIPAKVLHKNLAPVFSPTSDYKEIKCYEQRNGQDCGLHVVTTTRIILNYLRARKGEGHPNVPLCLPNLPTATPAQALTMRSELLAIINTLKVSGPAVL